MRFMLDPMRLDASSHGIFTTFPGLHTQERGVTYIPVRMDEIVLYSAGAAPTRCLIQIVSKTERSTVGNYYIYGAEGELIAILRGVQCQAVPIKRLRSLSQIALIELPQLIDGTISGNTGIPVTAKDLMAAASSSDVVPAETPRLGDQALLVEGWATAAAHEIVFGLSDGIVVNIDALVESGSLREELRPWLVNLLLHLEAAGLVKQERGSWVVFRDDSLPSSTSVIKALAGEGHSLAAQLLLAGTMSGFAEDVAANRAVTADPASVLSKTALDFYDSTHRATHVASELLARLVNGIERRWPKDRAVRVLQIGVGALAQSIVAHFGNAASVTVYEPDQRRYEQAERRSLASQGVTLIGHEQANKLGTYDLIVSAAGLHRLPHEGGLAKLNELLAPYGALIAIELQPSLFNDLVIGMQPGWFAPGSSEYPVGALQPAEYWRSALENAGLVDVTTSVIRCDQEVASLLIAKAGPSKYASDHAGNGASAEKAERTLFFASEVNSPLAARLAELARASHSGTVTTGALSSFPALPPDTVVLADVSQDDPIDPVRVLTQRCMDIKSCAEKMGDAKATLWLVFSGALGVDATLVRPIETGAWAFSRTLANEFPNLDVRRIDISPSLAMDAAAAKIDRIIASGTSETEIHVDAGAVRAVRVQSLTRSVEQASAQPAPAARLYRRIRDVNRLAWQPSERKRPEAGEVEIAV
jgi:hypothetical protein